MAVVLVAIVVVVGGDVLPAVFVVVFVGGEGDVSRCYCSRRRYCCIVGNEGDVGRAYPHAGWYRGIVGVDCPRRSFSSATGFSTPLTPLPSRRFGNPRMRDFEPDT